MKKRVVEEEDIIYSIIMIIISFFLKLTNKTRKGCALYFTNIPPMERRTHCIVIYFRLGHF